MTKLAGFSGKEVVKRLEKLGYIVVRQKGSHVRLHHVSGSVKPLTVPLHREIKVGLLASIIKDVGLSIEDFLNIV